MCTHRDGKGVRITPSDSVTVTQTSRVERSKFEYRFGNVDLKQVVPYCVADEPWAFIRTVFFSLLTDNENGIWNDCRKVPDPEPDLELCAVCPALLKFLRYEEIPLDLLWDLGPVSQQVITTFLSRSSSRNESSIAFSPTSVTASNILTHQVPIVRFN
jgi:hypothetical protein